MTPHLENVALETGELPILIELRDMYIKWVLELTGGHKTKAAKILGINRRTLYRPSLKTTRMRGYSKHPEVTL